MRLPLFLEEETKREERPNSPLSCPHDLWRSGQQERISSWSSSSLQSDTFDHVISRLYSPQSDLCVWHNSKTDLDFKECTRDMHEAIFKHQILDAMQRSPRFILRCRAKERKDNALKTALRKPLLFASPQENANQEYHEHHDDEDVICLCDVLTPAASPEPLQASEHKLNDCASRSLPKESRERPFLHYMVPELFTTQPSPPRSNMDRHKIQFQHRGRRLIHFA